MAGSDMFVAVDAYDRHVGRYGRMLSRAHLDAAGVEAGATALDVGCGPGSLTAALADRLGAENVSAVDPSEPFAAACAERLPGVDVRIGAAETLPDFGRRFDVVLSQLVVNFMADAPTAARKMRAAARPGGTVGACVWDYRGEMTLLRGFWDAVLDVDPGAPDEGRVMPYCTPDDLATLWREAGLADVSTAGLQVEASYEDFDDLWAPFLAGLGPSGAFLCALEPAEQEQVRAAMHRRLGSPEGAFTLSARAWFVRGTA